MAANETEKDPLFAGLTRMARQVGLPVDVLSVFMIVATVIVLAAKVMGLTKYGFYLVGLVYFVLVGITYQEDRGVQYVLDYVLRYLKNGQKAFGGISYETGYRFCRNSRFAAKQDVDRENMERDKIPYLYHVTPQVIKTITGDLLTVIRLEGFNFETESYDRLALLKRYRADLYRQLSPRFVVYTHYVRRKVDAERHPDIDNPFFNDFEATYLKQQQKQKVFANDIYITLLIRRKDPNLPPYLRLKEALFLQTGNDDKLLSELDAAKKMLMEMLQDARPSELSVETVDGGLYDGTLNFLSAILNADHTPVPLMREEIRNYLTISRRVFKKNGVIQFKLPNGITKLGAVFGLPTRTYPEETNHCMIDAFLSVNREMVICESFSLMDRQESIKMSKRRRNQLQNAADESESQIENIKQALDDLASGRIINGYFQFNVMVLSDTYEDFEGAVNETRKAFAVTHLIPKLEEMLAEPSFYSMLPGNMQFIQRPAIVNTSNYAGFASLHNTKTGSRDGNHWGSYIIRLQTTSHTPYYFNFHEGDVGHTRFIAPTGGGKTTALNAMLAASLKHNPYIFHFDFEYSAAVFITAAGGQHFVLSPSQNLRWNPLQLDDTPENRDFLFNWLSFLGTRRNADGTLKPLTASEQAQVKDFVDQVYQFDKSLRKLGSLVDLFGIPTEGSLSEQIRKWCGNGHYAGFFDNDEDAFSLDNARLFGFEMKHIIANKEVLVAVSMYIFHRIDIAMKDKPPFIVVMEEGQRYIEDDYNKHWLKVMLTTYRRRNGMVIFVTPTPEVITEDDNLRQQFKTSILLPNAKASHTTYTSENGLMCTEKEYEWLTETNPKLRQFMIKNSNESVISKIDLSGMPEFIDIFSGDEKKFNTLQKLIKENGYRSYTEWKQAYHQAINLNKER